MSWHARWEWLIAHSSNSLRTGWRPTTWQQIFLHCDVLFNLINLRKKEILTEVDHTEATATDHCCWALRSQLVEGGYPPRWRDPWGKWMWHPSSRGKQRHTVTSCLNWSEPIDDWGVVFILFFLLLFLLQWFMMQRHHRWGEVSWKVQLVLRESKTGTGWIHLS